MRPSLWKFRNSLGARHTAVPVQRRSQVPKKPLPSGSKLPTMMACLCLLPEALLACLTLLCVSPAAAQSSVRLYEGERAAEAAIAAFPDAGKAGSPLHERMPRRKLEDPT
eukprot:gene19236-23571_t